MAGKVEWIGVRPERKAQVVSKDSVNVNLETGIEGDHPANANRQVTVISKEHLNDVSRALGLESIDPTETRRNIVISGLDFDSIESGAIQIGGVLLEITGPCRPCKRMDENLGEGGRSAMEGKGGWTTRVLEPGRINVGDEVTA